MTHLSAPPPVTMRDAARRIVGDESRALGRRNRLVRGGDAEAVHQMRVGTRRLRAALRVFGGYVATPRGLKRQLRRVARRLGAVRDRDVLIVLLSGEADGVAAPGPIEARRLAALIRALRRERERAMRRLVRRLEGRKHRRLRRRLAALAGEPELRGPREDTATAGLQVAIIELADDVERLSAMTAAAPSPDELHTLRIAFKRLRYVLEFHAGMGGVAYDAELKVARAMQDCLGQLHDVDVLQARLREGRGAFAGRWSRLKARLAADRAALLDRFGALRERWRERTAADVLAAAADDLAPYTVLEPAPVQLRLVTGAHRIASAMIR